MYPMISQRIGQVTYSCMSTKPERLSYHDVEHQQNYPLEIMLSPSRSRDRRGLQQTMNPFLKQASKKPLRSQMMRL